MGVIMFNKIYEKVLKFIKENYKTILIFLVLYIVLTIRLPYYIYIGGGIINLEKRIELTSEESGSYNLAYVKQLYATIPTYLLSFLIDSWTLESISNYTTSDESLEEIDSRNKLYLEEANSHAIINAYKLAGKEINIKKNQYKVIQIDKNSDTDIKVGDTLISVNGISVNNNSEYKEYLKNLSLNSKLNVKVIRDNKEIDCYAKLINLNGEKIIGLYLVNIYDFETNPPIELNFKWNESGPSGGFMLSLAIYDRLVPEDLTKGKKIVGTGTIDANGNVGEIGGVNYKLMGAVKNKADLFFVPSNNYEEAIKTKNKYNYDIKIIAVDTLQEAIDYLENN